MTSGIPLGPLKIISFFSRAPGNMQRTAGAGSGVVEASQVGRGIDAVCGGEDSDRMTSVLAMTITTTMTIRFTGSHCYDFATVAVRVYDGVINC